MKRTEVGSMRPGVRHPGGASPPSTAPRALTEVVRLAGILDDGMTPPSERDDASDAVLVAEFAESLAGTDAPGLPPATTPDPAFRERLRRRLWRLHLMSRPVGVHGRH